MSDEDKEIPQLEKPEELMAKQRSRMNMKIEREKIELDRDFQCGGFFSHSEHLNNIKASKTLLERLMYFHKERISG